MTHKSFPKHVYVRSKKLIEAYRLLPCQFDDCRGMGRFHAFACHSNWGWGKGRGIKCDDSRAASGCFMCHAELDQGMGLSEEERKRWWWDAHVRTVQKLQLLGAWPVKIAAPSVDTYPF
jgi:hypothetical protein